MAEDWGIWTGIECEGRLAGLKTVFFYAMPDGPVGYVELFDQYKVAYFCSQWLRQSQGAGYGLIRMAMAHCVVVTVDVEVDQLRELPNDIINGCHILLSITMPEFALLKRTDTFRVLLGQFNGVTVTREAMLQTTFSDYEEDRVLFHAKDGQRRWHV